MEPNLRGLARRFHEGENMPVPMRTDVSIQIRPAFPDLLEDDQVLVVQVLVHVTVDAAGLGPPSAPART